MAAMVVRSSVFRDTDQNSRLLSILNEQRATSRFCDVVLKVREDHIFAHSNVLAAASPYFGSFLGLGPDSPRAFCEKSPQVIEIQIDGADAGSGYGNAVRHVVEYMYTCSLELNSVIISQIAEIARIMQIQRVLDYCERFIKGESGPHPLDKRTLALTCLPDYGPSKRVKKATASTETELVMFQKSSGLPVEKLQQEMILSAHVPSTSVEKATVKNLSIPQIAATQDASDGTDTKITLDAQLDASKITDCQNSNEKGTQLDSDSLPDSQERNVDEFAQEENPIVLMKNEDGTMTGTVAVPFVNVPMGDQGLPVLVKGENPSPGPEPQSQSQHTTPSIFSLQSVEKPKLPSGRGRKRGRQGYRGRRRKLREVLSDSDPELIQEPDDADGLDLISLSAIKPTDIEMGGIEEGVKDLSSEPGSSQELPSSTSSATDTTVSMASGDGDVKEELPEVLTRTRGRKPITSVMASWTSPRRRAGIPRSVFRSDYVMHSLIRRSRHQAALQSTLSQSEDMTFDEEGNETMEACDALSKSMGGNSPGLDSSIKFVCQTCDFTTVSFRLYRQHMKRHPETDTRSYTCTECHFHTTKARQLLQHRKKHLHEDLICR